MLEEYKDRKDAGQKLARALEKYKNAQNTLVLGLPRGGVPVAAEIAKTLLLPLDIWLVRKLGVPGHEELAMGAIAPGGICHINPGVVEQNHISQRQLDEVITREKQELLRRNNLYRGNRPALSVRGKAVIVVDDGLATGATMQSAILSLRQAGVRHIVAAVPVGAASSCAELAKSADEVVCPLMPDPFYGVGQWYRDFTQLDDATVREILDRYFLTGSEKLLFF